MEVQFEEERLNNSYAFRSRKILGEPVRPGLVLWLVKKGIVRSEKRAGYLILALIILCLIISLVIVYRTFRKPAHFDFSDTHPRIQVLQQQQ